MATIVILAFGIVSLSWTSSRGSYHRTHGICVQRVPSQYTVITVFAGYYEGKPVAVKVTKPYRKAHHMYSKELRILQEVWAYQGIQKMPEIAGKTVSKLHAFLRLPNETFVLVIDRQQQSLSDCVDEHGCVPEELKERLLSSLRVLHSEGVAQ